jgi:hypothetical protein
MLGLICFFIAGIDESLRFVPVQRKKFWSVSKKWLCGLRYVEALKRVKRRGATRLYGVKVGNRRSVRADQLVGV